MPRLTGKEVAKVVEKLGFLYSHITGSHIVYKHPDGRMTVVHVHGNEDLGKGLLREILNQIKVSREEYEKLRK